MSAPTRSHRTGELAELRERLASAQGPEFWRGLEQLAETPEFTDYLHREFPEQASELVDPVNRRRFLHLMGASLALAGATACTGRTPERIVPYVRQPEEIIPGKPLYYASATTRGGYAVGTVVETHMGRPTKVEGNPEHPSSLGSSDSMTQASVLGLYDPDRSQVVLRNGRITTWEAFLAVLAGAVDGMGDGAGLRLLTPTVTAPTLAGQIERLLQRYPEARWHQYESAARDGSVDGTTRLFGEPREAVYDFARADVVLALDADLLAELPGSIRYTRDLSAGRRARAARQEMSRLYSIEATPTITGATADHRWRLAARHVESFARALAALVGVDGLRGAATAIDGFLALGSGIGREHLEALAADLRAHGAGAVVVPGDGQPAPVHALAHALNVALGAAGSTVRYTVPVPARAENQTQSLRELVDAMAAGDVELLVMLDVNPVYDAPADFDFVGALGSVATRVHVGLYADETAQHCQWHVPAAHELESWGDARGHDGTVSLQQPMIEPLYGGRSAIEVLAVMLGEAERDGGSVLKAHWEAAWADGSFDPALGLTFEVFWRRCLHDGLIAGTARAGLATQPLADWDRGPGAVTGEGLEAIFRPDPMVFDGRHANNGWLQETPKPLTQLTWDNAVLLSPATAERLGIESEQMVQLRLDGRTVEGPAWVLPGHADDSVTLHLGYGRPRTGRIGRGAGFDAGRLRSSSAMGFAAGLEIAPLDARRRLACTQLHHAMEGRDLVRVGTLDQFRSDGAIHGHAHAPAPGMSLYPPFAYEGHSWGMAIDLNLCTGCGGCVTACQAENNTPIVGREEVRTGREMHWIRIDRYWTGTLDEPETVFQPVTCMHCENAPCEVVCPVAATVHGDEGLNEMVYNRCVGTRYCANNCPYKVRRFNFFDYADTRDTPTLDLQRNPDVTVRSRGVMEKCTYCVQRINVARQDAKIDGRELRDGDVVTACQQACPAQAIVFGDINDPDSAITAARAEPNHYGLLEELGTRPRTNYLARLRNPNPAITDSTAETDDAH